ncbi:hypothetical protein GCM10007173_03560 [Glutamicibacter ardleyensis]|uniref:Uncharacterized protein n=1 Tax=Glutamicibacter ardleyensis TaxID=225894 RepID=A0ABQ2D705_9MICC|nr:hypothetical protein GCM10007173_03560 [Glutamicibacter ardleyensis]
MTAAQARRNHATAPEPILSARTIEAANPNWTQLIAPKAIIEPIEAELGAGTDRKFMITSRTHAGYSRPRENLEHTIR